MWTHLRFAVLCGLGLPLLGCGDTATQPNASPEAGRSATALSAEVPGIWRRFYPHILPPRGAMGAAVSGQSIVVVGGRGADLIPMSRVDAFNVQTRTWSTLKDLPEGRLDIVATTINGRIYVAGGRAPDWSAAKSLFVYDPTIDTWTRKADMPKALYVTLQAGLLGKLYVYGAGNLWSYSPRTDRWVSLPAPPTQHFAGVLTAVGGKLYLTSGLFITSSDSNIAHLDVYDPATKSWTVKQPMLHAGPGMVAVTFHDKLWVAGGGILQVYDPVTDQWQYGPPLLNTSAFGAGAYAGGKFFVIGGLEGGPTGVVQAFSTTY
jgi:N-acetylneuraminic acid mutarotase